MSPYETFLPKFDLNLANELLALFVGEHDFSAFMKLGSDAKSPVRRITKAFCYARGERTIIIFKANGFLRAQVRLMVASVLKALELAKSGKFRQMQAQEFKFERAEVANLDTNLNKKSHDNILTKGHESVNLAKFEKNANLTAEHAVCVSSKFDAKNSNLNKVANNCSDENFLKAKELLRQAIYEQKPLTRIPAPPNGLYLNRVFYE